MILLDNLEKITFDWEANREYLGLDEDTTGDFDFDLEVYTSVGGVFETGYNSAPEKITILDTETPDGLSISFQVSMMLQLLKLQCCQLALTLLLKVVKKRYTRKLSRLPSMESTVRWVRARKP